MLVPLKTAAAGCHCRLLLLQGAAWVLLPEWCVRFGAACWCRCRVPLKAGAGCCCCQIGVCALELVCWCRCLRVLLSELRVHFGVGMLQGAAAGRGVRFEAGMPVPLQGAAGCWCQSDVCRLWRWLVGASAGLLRVEFGWCSRVLLQVLVSECGVRYET